MCEGEKNDAQAQNTSNEFNQSETADLKKREGIWIKLYA